MKKIITIVVALAALTIAATAAQAGGRGKRMNCAPGMSMQQQNCAGAMGQRQGRGGGIHRLLAMADEIGLNEDQIGRLKTMSTEFRKSMIDDRAELQKAQVDLHILRMDDSRADDVFKLMDNIGRMKTEMQKNRYLHRQQIEAVLTDDQRDKLEELRLETLRSPRGLGFQGNPRGARQGSGMGYGPGNCDGTGFGYMDLNGF